MKVKSLIENTSIEEICANNVAYLNNNLDQIISTYQGKLEIQQSSCVDNSIFCYIGHLYEKKNDPVKEEQCCGLAMVDFKQNKHICKHTVPCFTTFAQFYMRTENFFSTVRAYDDLIQTFGYIESFFISPYFNISCCTNTHRKTVIILFEHLIQTILKEHNDYLGVDKEFQKALDICKNLDDSILVETYSSYLEIMLRYRCISHHAQLSAIEPPFCQVLSIYKAYNNTRRVICTYQKFLELIISTITNYATFVDAVQHLALDLETAQLVNEALGMHMRFARFILTCNTKETILKVGFIIVRYQLLAKNGA
ncbi:unnamed protein product [Adineta ricciae]|uniref:Uncharacterized protein n=1 Tax=Adineta ricciae TaxID=249248 RepID=A0A815UBA3_ADIRI|nr:unnamed protein product [Adineta ricciae]CAF1514555.1 unnamed protein product [Adineta ricciae]